MADGVALRINRDPSTGGVEYTAQDERLFASMGLMPGATGLAVRDGRRLGPGLEISVSGDGLSVVVQPGVAVVSHAVSSGGPYIVAIPATATRALPTRPATGQKRYDAVVIDVLDEDVTQKVTTLREANIAVVAGTATSGTPTAPPAGIMQLTIGVIYYNGTNTPEVSFTQPRYTWSAGGVGVVFSQTERDGLTAYNGLKVYRNDLGKFQQYRQGAWEDEQNRPDAWITYGILAGTGYSNNGTRLRVHGTRVYFEFSVQRSDATTVAAGSTPNTHLFTINPEHRPGDNVSEAGNTMSFMAGNGTAGGVVQMNLTTSTGELKLGYTNRDIANGHRLRGVLQWYLD